MLNKIVIMGRLTRDPELRQTQSGTPVTSFSIACDRDFKPKDGEKETDFIDVVAWRATAEFVCKYFKKAAWRSSMAVYRSGIGPTRRAASAAVPKLLPAMYTLEIPGPRGPRRAMRTRSLRPRPAVALGACLKALSPLVEKRTAICRSEVERLRRGISAAWSVGSGGSYEGNYFDTAEN